MELLEEDKNASTIELIDRLRYLIQAVPVGDYALALLDEIKTRVKMF
jgi:hypothetical protein